MYQRWSDLIDSSTNLVSPNDDALATYELISKQIVKAVEYFVALSHKTTLIGFESKKFFKNS